MYPSPATVIVQERRQAAWCHWCLAPDWVLRCVAVEERRQHADRRLAAVKWREKSTSSKVRGHSAPGRYGCKLTHVDHVVTGGDTILVHDALM